MKKLLVVVLCISMIFALVACKDAAVERTVEPSALVSETPAVSETPDATPSEEPIADIYSDYVVSETENTITLLDYFENEVTIDKNPEKVIVMQNSLLDLWYLSGGTCVARTTGTINVPECAMELPEVGKTTAPNLELLLANEADLIILSGTTNAHNELEEVLKENNLQYIYVSNSVKSYESTMKLLYAFSHITGNEQAYKTNAKEINEGVSEIVNKVKDLQAKKVAVLFASSKSVKLETTEGLTGEMVSLLGSTNILGSIGIKGETKVDFSLEKIVEEDPDIVLVCVMGTLEKVQNKMAEDFQSNEAWNSIQAIKDGNVYYLPKDLFMYKPNGRYPEAFEYLAKILYDGEY